MMDATRALLDELMGKDRNVHPAEKTNRIIHFTDPDICKFYICGFCPHELFTNTKSDLGPCKQVHDDACKEDFQRSSKKHTFPYEREFISFLEKMVDDLDRKIRKGHERVDNQDEKLETPLSGEIAEKVSALSNRIQALLKQIEDLGEEGRVDESQQLMKVVDQLKTEKETIVSVQTTPIVLSSQEKRMKICEICGAFLVIGDTEKRVSSHLEGKQHVGFALIRKTLDDYKRHTSEERRDRDTRDYDRRYRGPGPERDHRDRGMRGPHPYSRDRDREDRERLPPYSRDRRDDRFRDDRDKYRDKRDKSRSPSPSRDRRRSRSPIDDRKRRDQH